MLKPSDSTFPIPLAGAEPITTMENDHAKRKRYYSCQCE